MKEERKEVKREKGATHRIKKREREISIQKRETSSPPRTATETGQKYKKSLWTTAFFFPPKKHPERGLFFDDDDDDDDEQLFLVLLP